MRQVLSMGFKSFDLGVSPTFENSYFVNTNAIVSANALVFHMNIPCDKVFLLVLNILTLTFDHFLKSILNILSNKNRILELRYCKW